MMAKLEGLEVSQPLQFGVGNPPANSLTVSVGSVGYGYGYGKDVVSDVVGQESDRADAKFVQLLGL